MSCFEYLKSLLIKENITLVSSLPISECRVLREYKLTRCGFNNLSSLNVYMLAVPYKCQDDCERNISEYAVSCDYHLYFKNLFDSIIKSLTEKYPNCKFCGFADDSPIDEIHAAARSGLGIIGKNNLLITKPYSSYIFLGEIITDYAEEIHTLCEISECMNCGACQRVCPKNEIGACLSTLTQKKGVLTINESEKIKKFGSVWGCDICQAVCPYTKKAISSGKIYTDIEFFKENRTPYLTKDAVENMSDEEFSIRAYSWRKKETVLRNLDIIYSGKEESEC